MLSPDTAMAGASRSGSGSDLRGSGGRGGDGDEDSEEDEEDEEDEKVEEGPAHPPYRRGEQDDASAVLRGGHDDAQRLRCLVTLSSTRNLSPSPSPSLPISRSLFSPACPLPVFLSAACRTDARVTIFVCAQTRSLAGEHQVSSQAAAAGLVALCHPRSFSWPGNFAEIFYIGSCESAQAYLLNPVCPFRL